MAWNANGLLKHQNELQAVLATEKIDVCLISESHFTRESYIHLNGYKIYHALHPVNTARGGSTLIIRENIYHYLELKYEEEFIQTVAVRVKTKYHHITVAAIYCPPKHALKIEQYRNLLKLLGNTFILGGDLNAKHIRWGSRLTNTKGRELLSAMREINCNAISTGKPTYWPTDTQRIPDLIDFFIFKNLSATYLHIQEGFDMNSDHSPIILTLSETIIQKESNPTLVNKNTDWDSFKFDLDNMIDLKVPLKNNQQLDKEVSKFVTDIQNCAWGNTPLLKRKVASHSYPLEIRNLIAIKRAQRQKWQQSRYPPDKTMLNRLTKRLSKAIQEYHDDATHNYLSQLTSSGKTEHSLWKATKRLNKPIVHASPIKQIDGKWAISNEQKANIFAEHLQQTFQTSAEESSEKITLDVTHHDELNIRLATPKEVQNMIKNLAKKKSPGYDLITGELLQNLPRKAIVKLTTLINATFRLKHVPDIWKVAEVIMIPKPGKSPQEVTSYRPISLLPIISKLFEKLLIRRIKPIIEDRKLIPNYQFGFREKHSTIDQVHRITNIIERTLEEKKVCSTVFLDVAQAFDKVWHKGLIYKLRKMLPKQFADILESYLTERTFRVRHEDAYSDLKQIKAGVPQGSVLGPILYLLYTCDIPEMKNNFIATFADDTAIMAIGVTHKEAVDKVQIAVNSITNWTKKWRIKLNESKSTHIDFTNRSPNYTPVYINGCIIPYENTAKYLGMTLDAKLRWKAHVKKKRLELDIRYRNMYWLLGRHSSLSVYNKVLLYKQVLMPVWAYGIQLWGCTKRTNVEIIQRFQNKVLRSIVNAPWYIRNEDIHRDLGVDLVAKVIKKYAEAHEERLHKHVNVEAIQLLDTTDIIRRLKRTKPFELV